MNCGGFGAEKPMKPQVSEIAMKVKPQVEAKMNATYATYEPLTFATQVVAGTNFLITIKTDNGNIKIKVWQKLPCEGGALELLEAGAA